MTLQSALPELFLSQDWSGACEKMREVLPWVTGVHATCRPQVTICAEPHQDLPLGNGSKPASVLASNSPLFLIVQMQLKQGCSCRSLKERTKSISVCLSFPTACLGASNVRIPGVAPAVPLASECCSRESSQLKILNRSIIPNPKNTKCPFFWTQLRSSPSCEGKIIDWENKMQQRR